MPLYSKFILELLKLIKCVCTHVAKSWNRNPLEKFTRAVGTQSHSNTLSTWQYTYAAMQCVILYVYYCRQLLYAEIFSLSQEQKRCPLHFAAQFHKQKHSNQEKLVLAQAITEHSKGKDGFLSTSCCKILTPWVHLSLAVHIKNVCDTMQWSKCTSTYMYIEGVFF